MKPISRQFYQRPIFPDQDFAFIFLLFFLCFVSYAIFSIVIFIVVSPRPALTSTFFLFLILILFFDPPRLSSIVFLSSFLSSSLPNQYIRRLHLPPVFIVFIVFSYFSTFLVSYSLFFYLNSYRLVFLLFILF